VHLDNFEVFDEPALTYSLQAGAPTNASIHPVTGLFTWTPTEAQGPGTNTFTVIVSDNAMPPRTDQRSFQVLVRELNRAPVLTVVADFAVHAGNVVSFTNTATDQDLPSTALTWSMVAPAPSGAIISPTTGRFLWTPGDALIGSTVPVHVRATDQGVPPLSGDMSFQVTVRPRPQAGVSVVSGGGIEIRWSAIPGRRYRVLAKSTLTQPQWDDLSGPVTAVADPASFLDPAPGGQRFYRVRALD
jgi:hypothetical protein